MIVNPSWGRKAVGVVAALIARRRAVNCNLALGQVREAVRAPHELLGDC